MHSSFNWNWIKPCSLLTACNFNSISMCGRRQTMIFDRNFSFRSQLSAANSAAKFTGEFVLLPIVIEHIYRDAIVNGNFWDSLKRVEVDERQHCCPGYLHIPRSSLISHLSSLNRIESVGHKAKSQKVCLCIPNFPLHTYPIRTYPTTHNPMSLSARIENCRCGNFAIAKWKALSKKNWHWKLFLFAAKFMQLK